MFLILNPNGLNEKNHPEYPGGILRIPFVVVPARKSGASHDNLNTRVWMYSPYQLKAEKTHLQIHFERLHDRYRNPVFPGGIHENLLPHLNQCGNQYIQNLHEAFPRAMLHEHRVIM